MNTDPQPCNFQRITELFIQKIVTKLSKIWVWDPGSGKNLFRIPDLGVKNAPDPGSQIRIRNTDHKTGRPSSTCEAGRRTLVTMYPTAKRPSFCWMYTRCDGRTVSGVGGCTPEVRYLVCILNSVADPWHFESMPLNDGSGSFYFHYWPSRCQQKTNLKKKKILPIYYFLKVLLHHFSKIKSEKEVTKQKKSRLFLLYLLNDRRIRIQSRIRIRIHTTD